MPKSRYARRGKLRIYVVFLTVPGMVMDILAFLTFGDETFLSPKCIFLKSL
jgi:hypothetical protein